MGRPVAAWPFLLFSLVHSLDRLMLCSVFHSLINRLRLRLTHFFSVSGPDGCRGLLLRAEVAMSDGSTHVMETSTDWQARAGPVTWDHFFHGENYDGTVDAEWMSEGNTSGRGAQAWTSAVVCLPPQHTPHPFPFGRVALF